MRTRGWGIGMQIEGRVSWGNLNLVLEEEQEPRHAKKAEAPLREDFIGALFSDQRPWKLQDILNRVHFPGKSISPQRQNLKSDTTDHISQALN